MTGHYDFETNTYVSPDGASVARDGVPAKRSFVAHCVDAILVLSIGAGFYFAFVHGH